MPLTLRHHPEHAAGDTGAFGMDFTAIIPLGMAVAGPAALAIFTNTQPPVAADADWQKLASYQRGRAAVFQILSGGKPGTDYQLQWTVTDDRGSTWVRTSLILVAPTS